MRLKKSLSVSLARFTTLLFDTYIDFYIFFSEKVYLNFVSIPTDQNML